MTAPLHTATIADKPVRFYHSPLSGPDFPWHAVRDLYAAARLPDVVLVQLTQSWTSDLRTLPSDAGPVLIGAHWMAQGLLEALEGLVGQHAGLSEQYTHAIMAASKLSLAHLPLAERITFMAAAFARTEGGSAHVH